MTVFFKFLEYKQWYKEVYNQDGYLRYEATEDAPEWVKKEVQEFNELMDSDYDVVED